VADLPHHLIASFRATLEEAIHGHLLLHVADASHDRVEHQIAAVEGVLDELGCDRERVLLVLNKIDRVKDPMIFTLLAKKHPRGRCSSRPPPAKARTSCWPRWSSAPAASRCTSACGPIAPNGKLMGLSRPARPRGGAEVQRLHRRDAGRHGGRNKVELLRMFGRDVEVTQSK